MNFKLILPCRWHSPGIPFSLEGEEGTGAQPAAQRLALQLLAVLLQQPGGWLAPVPVTAFTDQLHPAIYSRYSKGEGLFIMFHRETVKYQQFSSTVMLDLLFESTLQDTHLYYVFSLVLYYLCLLKTITRKEFIPNISSLKQRFMTSIFPPSLT